MIGNLLKPNEKAEVLREAYRKHAAELLAIEDGQFKLIGLLLGVFGAGASFLAGMKELTLPFWAKIGPSCVIGAITLIGVVQSYYPAKARAGTRALLVRCEEALSLYDPGTYVAGEPLYAKKFITFPLLGRWLAWVIGLVVLAGSGFVVLLWAR